MKPAGFIDYIRDAAPSFFRLPLAPWSEPGAWAGAESVILGVPWDGGTSYRPGARFAPYEVRSQSAAMTSVHPGTRREVFDLVPSFDAGNVPLSPFDAGAMRESVEQVVGLCAANVPSVFVVGGDHSVTLPALRAMHRRHGPLALVHIDAHFDTSSPELWGEKYHHGTIVRCAYEEGLLAEEGLAQVGLRAPMKSADEDALSVEAGAMMLRASKFEREGAWTLGRRVREFIGARPAYISVDVDAVDPAFAPGTGTPVPGGLSSRELLVFLQALAGLRIVGGDVVEISPPLDQGGTTSLLGAHLLFELLSLRAEFLAQ